MCFYFVEERECEFINVLKVGILNYFERYWFVFNFIFSLIYIKLWLLLKVKLWLFLK